MNRASRTLVRVLALVFLGTATTVAIAWGFALRGIDRRAGTATSEPPVAMLTTTEDGPAAIIISPQIRGTGFASMETRIWAGGEVDGETIAIWPQRQGLYSKPSTFRIVDRAPDARHLPSGHVTSRTEAWFGWPACALWTAHNAKVRMFDEWPLGWTRQIVIRPGSPPWATRIFHTSGSQRRTLALPTGILLRGFALNTAIYSSAWWTMLIGIPRLRRWNRTRRGMCARCAYDLRGLDAGAMCPECGPLLPMRQFRLSLRTTIRVGIPLVLGITTTVAVSWALATRGVKPARLTGTGWPSMRHLIVDEKNTLFYFPANRGLGVSAIHAMRMGAAADLLSREPTNAFTRDIAKYPALNSPPRGAYLPVVEVESRSDYRFGFPFLAMWSALDELPTDWIGNPSTFSTRGPLAWRHLLWIRKGPRADDAPFRASTTGLLPPALGLPTGIVPLGFTANTIIFAGIWWAALFGVRDVRRWNRIRRGSCPRCDYDRRGLDLATPCPECGAGAAPTRPCTVPPPSSY